MKRLLDSNVARRSVQLATLASLCFAAAAYAPGTRAAGAHASAAHPKMALSAYVDAADGPTLMAGDYDAVIASLASHGRLFKQDEVAASTNLCVAYIKTHRWSEAHPACDEAIRFAKLELPEPPQFPAEEHSIRVAVAYSNRAVLECLEHRAGSAEEDLAKARALAPGSEVIAHNLARLHAPLTTAGTRSPLPRSAPAAAMAAHG